MFIWRVSFNIQTKLNKEINELISSKFVWWVIRGFKSIPREQPLVEAKSYKPGRPL